LVVSVLLQTIVSGVLTGLVYVAASLGLTLTMGLAKVMNVAHGALVVLGSYLALTLFLAWNWSPMVALLAALPAFALVGWILERSVARPLNRNDETLGILVLFGVSIVLENAMSMVWSTNTQVLTAGFTNASWTVAGLTVPDAELVAGGIGLAVVLATYVLLQATFVGKAMRAVAQNEDAALLLGVDVRRLQGLVFILGVVLAGLGGVAVATAFPFSPDDQVQWLIWAFVVVVVGGVDDIRSALVAGLAVGVVQAVGSLVLPFQYVDFVVYTFLALALLVRSRTARLVTRAL
jgi:branched-chain amino acid transport system permease protein